jgi:tRNA pseudouridine55 synthase
MLVDKPKGLTSHDVVARVRRVTGEGRVGHAGTLDPMATGLLVVLVGPFTRLERYLAVADKRYRARIRFGTATDTDDAEGGVIAAIPVPSHIMSRDFARDVVSGLKGDILQVPPSYSALKVGGRVAHRVARSGGSLVLDPRPVRVIGADLLGVDPVDDSWDVDLIVSKGTYIRSIARDLGSSLDTVAHLSALRRIASGVFRVEDAHSLEEVLAAPDPAAVTSLFIDPVTALGFPVLEVDPVQVRDGRPLEAPGFEGPVSIVADDALLGIYRASGNRLVPEVVFPVPPGTAS